ncbi:penicillin acylase family protein [Rhizobium etli]|uniref:penicillin acylase family protein n=1 Tax=Rhizobium etli TaxID=29449 RepID=UPI0003839ED5|nr:penicillin acylase family protein [Rhizobium etli]AGS25313.1 penicillin amidase type protein [Rhizobium etli bv. mimosae str. Mim1]
MSSAVKVYNHSVAGLQNPAEIIIDQWGVAHIYAGSERDAFFLQGWNAARDRLWQIDLWRKRGLGRLSASFGPGYVEQDRASRLFLYRGDMDAEWAAYDKAARSAAEAFVEGINAYVARVTTDSNLLPIEFRLTGSKPELWSAEDIIRIRSNGLSRNLTSEVKRAQSICAAGIEADSLRKKLVPQTKPVVPVGLDPCAIPPEVLRDFVLATSSVSFSGEKKKASLDDPKEYRSRLAALENSIETTGSNNWTIAPSRTVTGRPILSGDPHRDLAVPSLRYAVHLSAPGLNAIGAGEPALPGISMGHNDAIAFGLTIFPIDQEDLYVYDLDPADPDRYRYKDGYEKMHTVTEQIAIKGEAARNVDLKFTRHGPVVYADLRNNRAFALRSIWFEPGSSAYFSSFGLMKAKSWKDFDKAAERWGAPSLNQLYADILGNIGWKATGFAPVRPNWDGLMPVPGDGRYEWNGLRGGDELPSLYNPEEGFLATANAMNIPEHHRLYDKLSFEWSSDSRIKRIREVFAAKAKWALTDAMSLQTDDTNVLGRRIVKLLATLHSIETSIDGGLKLLKDWDGHTSVSSAPAALAEVWLSKHLGKGVVAAATPEAAQSIVDNGDLDMVADLLETPDKRLGDEPLAARDRILLETLGEAVQELTERLGPDSRNWAWGKLHHAEFENAISTRADASTQAQLNIAPLQLGGSNYSPMLAHYRNSDFRTTAGASFRMVLDVGDWDNSRAINSPGQSGDPFSPHYRDLVPLWASGDYFPFVYSRGAIESAASQALNLSPAE